MWPGDRGDRGERRPPIRQLVDAYVTALKASGAIRTRAVERAFRRVERHRLVETFYRWNAESQGGTPVHHDPEDPAPEHLGIIYSDTALGTRFVGGMPASSSSQPSLVAEMLELLDLAPGMKVLEIGAGTGYNAALMAEIVGDQSLIVTIDVQDDVVEQTRRLLARGGYGEIRVLLRDGAQGATEDAPFDRIVATVGCSDLAPAWGEQLASTGSMLVPLEHAGGHPLVRVWRDDGGGLRGKVAGWSGFMPARGPLHAEDLWSPGVVRPDAEEPVQERDPWPGYGIGEQDPRLGCSAEEVDLLFYLGLRDRRACWGSQGIGLSDGLRGWALVNPGRISWWKEASLVEELDRLYEDWRAMGRPTIRDYHMAFVPWYREHTLDPEGAWVVERPFFRQLVWL